MHDRKTAGPQAIKLCHTRVKSQIETNRYQSLEGAIQPRRKDEHSTILNTPQSHIRGDEGTKEVKLQMMLL